MLPPYGVQRSTYRATGPAKLSQRDFQWESQRDFTHRHRHHRQWYRRHHHRPTIARCANFTGHHRPTRGLCTGLFCWPAPGATGRLTDTGAHRRTVRRPLPGHRCPLALSDAVGHLPVLSGTVRCLPGPVRCLPGPVRCLPGPVRHVYRCCRTLSDVYRCCQTLSDVYQCCQTLSDAYRCCQTLSDVCR